MGYNDFELCKDCSSKEEKISKMIANTITIVSCLIVFVASMLIVLH